MQYMELSAAHTNSSAVPKLLFLQASAVYIMYSPSPHTTTKLGDIEQLKEAQPMIGVHNS